MEARCRQYMLSTLRLVGQAIMMVDKVRCSCKSYRKLLLYRCNSGIMVHDGNLICVLG